MGYYGYPERSRRILSWSLLRTLAGQVNMPWVVMGYFNDLLNIVDKNGRVDHPPHLFRGFRDAISDYRLVDVNISGFLFMWERGIGTLAFVQQRLDRAMGNNTWHDLFPNARLVNLVVP